MTIPSNLTALLPALFSTLTLGIGGCVDQEEVDVEDAELVEAEIEEDFRASLVAEAQLGSLEVDVADGDVGASVAAAAAGDQSVFVSQSVTQTMTAGYSYNVSVKLKNTGTTTWRAANDYALVTPYPNSWSPRRVNLPAAVAPGAQVTFSFRVTPPSVGTHTFKWRMRRAGEAFGASTATVLVKVVAPPPLQWDYSVCRVAGLCKYGSHEVGTAVQPGACGPYTNNHEVRLCRWDN